MKRRNTWFIFGASAFAAAVLIMAVVLIAEIMNNSQQAPLPVAGVPRPVFDLGAKSQFMRIDSPRPDDKITSPLTVVGAARAWYFEGSFPVELKDGNGNTIASGIAQAQGDWMSDAMVPFAAALTFTKPGTSAGTLILKKDNPSGLPQNDDQVQVEVHFAD